jgi:hypothetical protein
MGDRGGLDPGGDAQFGEDVGDVDAGGLGADEQRLGDLAVAAAGRHQREDFGLARGQAELGRRRRRAGAAGRRYPASMLSEVATRLCGLEGD